MMNFVRKMMHFVLKMMNFLLKQQPSVSFNGASGHIDIMVGPKGTLPKPPEDVMVVVPFHANILVGNMNARFEENMMVSY